jgi:cytochrome c oxidase subunit II
MLPGCAPTAASKQGEEIATFYNVVFFLAVLIFVGINGALVYFVVRYRRKPTDVDMPPQIHGSTTAEITWTVLPALVVFALFGMSWSSMRSLDKSQGEPGVVVEVQGFQWNWQFNYGDGLIVRPPKPGQPPLMKVPINEPVRFVLTSDNVIHAFSVPEMLFKRDVVPGRINQFDVTFDAPATYKGQCAEFCGTDHAVMNFTLEAINRQDFDAWAKEAKAASCQGQPAGEIDISSPAGQVAFDKSCMVAPANQPVRVTYTNGGGQLHNWTLAKSAAEPTPITQSGPPIDKGSQTITVPPQPAGQLYFYCLVHPGMNGTYKVQ